MNKQNYAYRIMNYFPRQGTFNLLEILFFVAGILVAVLLFQLTAERWEIIDLTHRNNLILGLGAGSILLSHAWMISRHRKMQESHLKQLETEREQRSQISAALITERNKLSTLLATWPNPVLILDIHTSILDASSTAAHFFGVSKPELLRGRNALDMEEPDLANKSWRKIRGF